MTAAAPAKKSIKKMSPTLQKDRAGLINFLRTEAHHRTNEIYQAQRSLQRSRLETEAIRQKEDEQIKGKEVAAAQVLLEHGITNIACICTEREEYRNLFAQSAGYGGWPGWACFPSHYRPDEKSSLVLPPPVKKTRDSDDEIDRVPEERRAQYRELESQIKDIKSRMNDLEAYIWLQETMTDEMRDKIQQFRESLQ